METIKEIKEETKYFDGYRIITDKQEIQVGINNKGGYFAHQADLTEFIGAQIIEITTTDTALNTKRVEQNDADSLDGGEIMFVNVETTKGTLQLTVYNSHNGYYGHAVWVWSKQFNIECCL